MTSGSGCHCEERSYKAISKPEHGKPPGELGSQAASMSFHQVGRTFYSKWSSVPRRLVEGDETSGVEVGNK